MAKLPSQHAAEFIEIDADDARHFGYLGPHGLWRFLAQSVLPRMAPVEQDPTFVEALTDQGWQECLLGTGAPRGSLVLRLYPAAVHYFVDLARHAGEGFMHDMFLDEYVSRLACPPDK